MLFRSVTLVDVEQLAGAMTEKLAELFDPKAEAGRKGAAPKGRNAGRRAA